MWINISLIVIILAIIAVIAYNSTKKENLDARTRNYVSDGYRSSVSGTMSCKRDSECEYNERCQGGYCQRLF